ncbi:MAG: hypothetical protein LIO77_06940 [Rikenellaceae bacterium]|nr:hypothetical protein [Rikenellaceae bacterium]
MNRQFLLVGILSIASIFPVQAQFEGQHEFIQIASPQVAEMIRYDNHMGPSNTGKAEFEIPLITIDDPDFDVSILLSYNSSGMKVSSPGNYVGMDWSLKTAGVIYREVRGMPDDHPQKDGVYYATGFLENVKYPAFNQSAIENALFSNPEGYYRDNLYPYGDITPEIMFNGSRREANSDVYHFNFGRHAGKFMINYDGTVSVVSYTGGKYVVNLGNYKMQTSGSAIYNTGISIRTDDGYVYNFGGNIGAIEYTAASWTTSRDLDQQQSITRRPPILINAFHLTSITAPNGRYLLINYVNNVPDSFHDFPLTLFQPSNFNNLVSGQAHWNYVLDIRPYERVQVNKGVDFMNGNQYYITASDVSSIQTKTGFTHTLTKIALINTITIDDQVIQFSYLDREQPVVEYNNNYDATEFATVCGVRLERINAPFGILTGGNFIYRYYSGRMYLRQVSNKFGNYIFDYETGRLNSLPEIKTTSIDHWGYWNGASNGTKLVPSYTSVVNTQDVTYTGNQREPHSGYNNAGLLKRVTFPTGGFTEFTYEPHSYSSAIEQLSRDGFRKVLRQNSGSLNREAGGVRIKRMESFLEEGKPDKTTEFFYTDTLGSARSSGLMMYTPRYHFLERISYFVSSTVLNKRDDFVHLDGAGVVNRPAGEHIQYSTVIEKTGNNYKLVKFTDYATNPDIYTETSPYKPYQNNGDESIYFDVARDVDFYKWYMADLEDMSHERGKVLSESHFTAEGMASYSKYTYGRFGTDKYGVYLDKPDVGNSWFNLYYRICREPLHNYMTTSRTVTEFSGAAARETTRNYTYDSEGYLKSETTITSKGETLLTTYTYALERTGGYYEVMRTRNANPLIDQEVTLLGESGEKPLYSRSTIYGPGDYMTGMDWHVVKNVKTTIGADSENYSFFPHDYYYNPMEITKNGLLKQVVIWGHKGKWPIAVIEGSSYDEVKRALGFNDSQMGYIFTQPASPDANFYILVGRLRSLLPHASVTLYEYNSRWKLSRIIEPSGEETCFTYAGSDLIEAYRIINGQKVVIQSNNYNYNINPSNP